MDDEVRLQRKTIRMVLEQCQKTLELLKSTGEIQDEAAASVDGDDGQDADDPSPADRQADELHELLKSKVESQDFLGKLGSIHMSVSNNISAEDCASWDIISSNDLWEDKNTDGDKMVMFLLVKRT